MSTPNSLRGDGNGGSTSSSALTPGWDLSQIAAQGTNIAIITHFLDMFKKVKKLNARTISGILGMLTFALALKVLLEDTSTYIDKFKFSNLDYLKYWYQYFRCSEKTYEIVNVSNRWVYCGRNISMTSLTPFLELKSIYIQQPNTYYYSHGSFIVKVVITSNKITFHVPNVLAMTRYMNDNMDKYQEILLGNKTSMHKVTLTVGNNIVQFAPMKSIYAFETDDYLKLHKSLTSTFVNDSIVNMRQAPLILSFDGKPGTGKTTFGSYIADKGLFDRIFLYNLVQACGIDFKNVIIDLERMINSNLSSNKKLDGDVEESEPEKVLLIFDEVDKYLDSFICYKIDAFRNDARMKKETKANSESVVESFIKLTIEEEAEKRQQLRNEFLDILYNLCDGHLLKTDKQYVIIFNTNDFDSLFANAPEKYDALKDRFQPYKFVSYVKPQIIKFIDDIRNKLITGSTKKIANKKKEIYETYIKEIENFDVNLYDDIPDNIEITSRSLSKVLIDNCFDFPKIIKCLTAYANSANSANSTNAANSAKTHKDSLVGIEKQIVVVEDLNTNININTILQQ